MRAIAAGISLGMVLVGATARSQNNAQNPPVSTTQAVPTATSPDYSAIYCSNFVSSENIGDDLRLISGEQSNSKIAFLWCALSAIPSTSNGSSGRASF